MQGKLCPSVHFPPLRLFSPRFPLTRWPWITQPMYMLTLSTELVNENSLPHVRNAAGLALKNALTAKVSLPPHPLHPSPRECLHADYRALHQDAARQLEYTNRWLALDNDARNKVKQEALMALGSSNNKVGTVAAQVVSAIAAVELPQGQWLDIIEVLLGFVNNPANTNLRVATLQAIGFICETIVRPNQAVTLVISYLTGPPCARNLRFCLCAQMRS